MSFKRELLVSFGLQGTGAAAILLATLWLGVSLGPEAQGIFSHIKAEIEFISAFAMFGLPQALFFYAKSGRLNSIAASRWAFGCALLALLLGAIYSQWSGQTGEITIALSCAAAIVTVHGIFRALLLVHDRAIWFNISTTLPQVLVFIGVGIAIAYGGINATGWSLLFVLAYISVTMLTGWRLYLKPIRASESLVKWNALIYYGGANWLAAALIAAAILFAQRWVDVTQGRTALGQFTMGMTLVQIPLTPVNYAGPLLFRRWMDLPGEKPNRIIIALIFIVLLVVALMLWSIARIWPDLWLGSAYNGVARVLAILVAGGAAEAASRILAVQVNARGVPWITVCAESSRWVVLVLGWVFLKTQTLEWICAVWALGAWAAAGLYMALMQTDALKKAT